jgi:alpha-tubulin suppressor-like RCC1 family protein
MYRHTGCHFIWYPPEFAFGGDPSVPQCQGFNRRAFGGGQPATETCYPALNPFGNEVGSQSSELYDPSCAAADRYSVWFWPSRPCHCRKFAHLKGGISDTVFKKQNMSTRVNNYGYLPFMNPFSVPMKISEAGCCWCASPDKLDSTSSVDDRIRASSYPFASQKYIASTKGASGTGCVSSEDITFNPQYRTSCYQYGISPYLQRLALIGDKNYGSYKSGFDIWTFGTSNQFKDLGPSYSAYQLLNNSRPGGVTEYIIKYREITGKQTKLRDALVGYITLEHHFESWAHRSDVGSIHPDLVPNLNHANVLVTPYERPYSGYINSVGSSNDGVAAKFKYHPEEAMRWSLMRTTPRRFMYVGSQIPLFHFDLYAFKDYCVNNSYVVAGSYFDPERFLKAYYNYFYSLSENPSQSSANSCTPIKIGDTILIDDYNYVIESLEGMVVAGILRVKDHAIDIAAETTQIIQSASFDNDGELVLNPYVSAVVGGSSGYINLVEFLGVQPVTGTVTPKIIKQKLLSNYTGAGDQDDMFLFPRRATLPVYLESNNVAAWGCKNNSCSGFNYNQSVVPGLLTPAGNNNDTTKWLVKSIVNVYTGLNTNYFITYNGKIVASGYSNNGLTNIPEDIKARIADESQNNSTQLGIVKKLGGKGIDFEIALIEYPEFFDYSPCPPVGTCEGDNGGDVCGAGSRPPEPDPDAPLQQYKLKAWGDKGCDNARFNIGDNALMNKTHRWSDVANGSKHTSAITSYGLLYTTGNNVYGQKKYGDQTNTNFLGKNYLTTHAAKPAYVSDIEYDVAIDPVNAGLLKVELNGITYINLNYWCEYPNTNEDPPADKRCILMDPTNPLSEIPIFTNIGAGYYHTIAIQSDNQVRVWGSYTYMDPEGTATGTVYTTFVPNEVKAISDQWNVEYYKANDFSSGDYSFVAKKVTNVSRHSDDSQLIFADGGPDYSMVANKNTVYVWGRTEMLPSWKSTDTESTFGSWSKTFDGEIIKITAGANGFAVLYKSNNDISNVGFGNTSFKVNKTYIWTRQGESAGQDPFGLVPTDEEDISEFGYSDISFGYAHAIAIKYGDIIAPVWNYNDFADPEAKVNQFKSGSSSIPKYFKRQAFFRAVPGAWDFSKWLWGGYCAFSAEGNEVDNPVRARDLCSVLGEPDPTDGTGLKNDNYSYSGHPEYYWMSALLRRYQNFVPNHSVQPSPLGDECLTYSSFGSNANTSGMVAGVNGAASSCPEKADLCWQATGLPQHKSSTYWAPQDPACIGRCDNSCDRSSCVRNCCPPVDDTTVSDTCTDCVGRIGFNSSKDYFIQSYKNFSRQGLCCRTVMTNISYVNYASRLSYYGWDSESSTFKIFYTKDPYRFTRLIPSNATTSYKLAGDLMYPFVYVGGDILKQVQSSYNTSVYGATTLPDGTVLSCEQSGDVCLSPTPNETILGPGGWLWVEYKSDATQTPLTVYDSQTQDFYNRVWFYQAKAPLSLPYNILGPYTYGGFPTGATLPNNSTIPTGINLFDPDNANAYAPVYGSPSSTKWHKINVTRPNVYPQGEGEISLLEPLAFIGGISDSGIPAGANIIVQQVSPTEINIRSGNITCSTV